MLRSNTVLANISYDYRESQLMEDRDVAFLVKFMQDKFCMNLQETIAEIYNNH